MKLTLLICFIISSCSTAHLIKSSEQISATTYPSHEILKSHRLIESILDKNINSLSCFKEEESAEVFMRALEQYKSEASEQYEEQLDDDNHIKELIKSCSDLCMCQIYQDLFLEHQVQLSKKDKKEFDLKLKQESASQCWNKFVEKFCESKIFQKIDKEKNQFNY